MLGHHPDVALAHDVGFNYRVGRKFPHKSWPMDHWQALEAKCATAGLSVCWQFKQDNVDEIERYIDWIASCRVLVTNDSLGLHFAIALNKPVIALFGPTSHSDVPGHPALTKLVSPGAADCTPCAARLCMRPDPCMGRISVDTVYDALSAALVCAAPKAVSEPPRNELV